MEVLETGHLHFLFRPVVEEEDPRQLADVQTFELILHPRDRKHFRRLTIGRKRLPDTDENERTWGFVDQVTDDPEALRERLREDRYTTATLGPRHQPAARPAGEGSYVIARRGRDTYLAYELELPEEPGEVQQELNIAPEARFVLSIKNPEVGSPPGVGLPERSKPEMPAELMEHFGGRRWIAADPVGFLDHEGVELLLIAAAEDADVDGPPPFDEIEGRELTDLLAAERGEHPVAPLFEGHWD